MIEIKTILFFMFSPEIAFVVCLPFVSARQWWLKMIEDSDGDPHHTDGFFIVVLYASVWCFRIVFMVLGYWVMNDKQIDNVVMISLLTTGSALLGVRVFKNKISSNTTLKGEQ